MTKLLSKCKQNHLITKRDFDRCGGRPEVASGLRDGLGFRPLRRARRARLVQSLAMSDSELHSSANVLIIKLYSGAASPLRRLL